MDVSARCGNTKDGEITMENISVKNIKVEEPNFITVSEDEVLAALRKKAIHVKHVKAEFPDISHTEVLPPVVSIQKDISFHENDTKFNEKEFMDAVYDDFFWSEDEKEDKSTADEIERGRCVTKDMLGLFQVSVSDCSTDVQSEGAANNNEISNGESKNYNDKLVQDGVRGSNRNILQKAIHSGTIKADNVLLHTLPMEHSEERFGGADRGSLNKHVCCLNETKAGKEDERGDIKCSSEQKLHWQFREAAYGCGKIAIECSIPKEYAESGMPEKSHACDKCTESFNGLCSLKSNNSIHTGECCNVCDCCGEMFRGPYSLKQHQLIHMGEKSFACNICCKSFGSVLNLRRHKIIHVGKKSYVCDDCGKVFIRVSSLKEHRRSHTGYKPYACEICCKTFSKLRNMKMHKTIHTGESPYVCDYCDKIFTNLSSLKQHKKIHTGDKPYACEICCKAFRSLYNLKAHQLIHTGDSPNVCDICGKTFIRPSQLKEHLRIHTGEKPYTCDMCFETFGKTQELKMHKMSHTDESPYVCNICGKAFVTPSSLGQHKLIHSVDKSYTCNICSKACMTMSILNAHREIHKDERPYVCEICGKTFIRPIHLKDHKRIHITGERPHF